MRLRDLWFVARICLLLVASAAILAAAEPDDKTQEQAIRNTTARYLAALAKGDTKALEDFWTADGDFVDEFGNAHPARKFIAEGAKAAEEGKRPDVKVTSSKIRFLTADVAIEDGTSEFQGPQSDSPTRGRFTAVWVKQDGTWRLASLRESRAAEVRAPSQLADLDWMVGQWTAQQGDDTMEVSIAWNVNHTFLLRDFKVLKGGQAVFSGTQRIGRDPLNDKIRSWNFDAAGGYGEGIWTEEGGSWIVEAAGVTGDGNRTSSTNVYTYDGKDHIVWKSYRSGLIHGTPDLEVTLTRKPAKK